MCDYSLHNVAARPAKVGDKLVSTRFPNSITRGFAAIGEPNVGEDGHEICDAVERDEVILDVLAGGEVSAAAAEFVGNPCESVGLGSGEESAGDLAAHHLDAGLSLAVDPVFQPVGAEILVGNLPCQVGQCLGPEGLDLFPNRCIVLILKLFPLSQGFRGGCSHRRPNSGCVQSSVYL